MNSRFLIASLALTIGLIVGWTLIKTPQEEKITKQRGNVSQTIQEAVGPNPISSRKPKSTSARDGDFDPNAIPYERIISFENEDDYRRFLASLGDSKLRNLGQIDTLRAVRIGFRDSSDLDGLDDEQLAFNFPVSIPETRDIPPQSGIVGFGNTALAFLGITTDNSAWGEGVRIAVIDSGIEPHIVLTGNIQHINLVEIGVGAEPDTHGTSVASLIAGTHPNLMGVAPSADLISVRIVDESGTSSSFLLAEGIIAATDAGAQIINISLGSDGDSLLVQQAVEYATERGIAIFASSGNAGSETASFPAANENVFSVGAVDALGQHLNFSNSDDNLAFTAPGFQVQAAVNGDSVTSFTGTSGSVAFPVGAVAAIMSESETRISALDATELLLSFTNEAGTPGTDPFFGTGILDVGRAINRDTPGIEDLAVASQTFLFPDDATNTIGGLQVSIENRGTEPIFQSSLLIEIDGDQFPVAVQSIQPSERQVITIPAGLSELQNEGELSVASKITVGAGTQDVRPDNNQREEVILSPSDDS